MRRQIFLELAAAEKRHAARWAAKLTALGERVAEPGRTTLRTRLLSWLAEAEAARLEQQAEQPQLSPSPDNVRHRD
jgi:glycosyltransferase A (GT-A) superfamily protein (DUF2064 family)